MHGQSGAHAKPVSTLARGQGLRKGHPTPKTLCTSRQHTPAVVQYCSTSTQVIREEGGGMHNWAVQPCTGSTAAAYSDVGASVPGGIARRYVQRMHPSTGNSWLLCALGSDENQFFLKAGRCTLKGATRAHTATVKLAGSMSTC